MPEMVPGVLREFLPTPFNVSSSNSCERYFAAYEVTKKALTPAGASPADLNLGAVILAGGTAGVAMWALAIPPDASLVQFVA